MRTHLEEAAASYGEAPEDEADLAAAFARALAASRPAQLARGVTLVGPHRDDVLLRIGRADMRGFGSRGQQRTVALALKLAEARLIRVPAVESAVGTIRAVHETAVASKLLAKVREVNVQAGQAVRTGAVMVRLSTRAATRKEMREIRSRPKLCWRRSRISRRR